MIRRHQEPLAFAIAAAVFAACAVVPLAMLVAELPGAASLAVLGSLHLWRLFVLTAGRALLVVVIAVIVGVPLGLLLARTNVVGRRVALYLHAFPLFLPPFLLALGWFHVSVATSTTRLLFSSAGLIAVLAITLTPIVTVLTALALDGIDPSLEDAARVAAAPWRVAIRISLPIARPSIALAGLLVFALSVAELGVPMFLRVDAYPAAVFARLGGIDYAPGEAFVLILPLLGLALLLLAIERGLIGRRPFTVLGLHRRRDPFALGRWRVAATSGVWSIVVLGAVPLIALSVRADLGAAWTWLGDSLRNSLAAAAIGATAIVVLAIVLGRALARRHRGAATVDALALLAFVTPAAVIGVGLIATWNRASTSTIYGTSAIIIVGYMARYFVIGLRPMAVAIAQAPTHLEEAAAVTGASFLRRMIAIVVPVHRRAIVATWLLALVFCLRDEMAILYYPPGGETLPVRIFTLEANGPPRAVAGLAVIQIVLTALVLALGGLALRRWRR